MPEKERYEPSLSKRIAMLQEELVLAKKWDRPCISLAVYRSEFVRDEVQSRLKKSTLHQGDTLVEYVVDRSCFDVALSLRDHPQRDRSIFMISGLQWGGGRGHTLAYHALNMHREYLVDEKIRAVFWLTVKEARLLPRHAPDFWAFRSNVIEFLDYPDLRGPNSRDRTEGDGQGAVGSILAQLDIRPTDFQLQKKLAGVYRELGCYEDAVAAYRAAGRIAKADPGIKLDIAEVYLAMKRPGRAARIIQRIPRSERTMSRVRDRIGQLRSALQKG